MLFIVADNTLKEVPFEAEKLSPEQWDKIARWTGLPEKAKSELEDCIGFYRALRNDARKEYGEVWERVKYVRRYEQEALRSLAKLISSKEFLPALAMGLEHQVNIFDEELDLVRKWLMQVCEGKKKLLEWYDKASRRLKRSRTRVPSSLFNFIRILNAILEKHTRTRITSGRNDPVFQYVLELCRFAEPELNKKKGKGLSTVYETTKRVIREILDNRDAFDIEGWGELIPYWKPSNSISVHDPAHGIEVEFHEEGDIVRGSSRIPPEAIPVIFLTPLFTPEKQ
jgi:hypothetical protein